MLNSRPSVTLFYPLSHDEIKEKLRLFQLNNNLPKEALEKVEKYVVRQYNDLSDFIEYGNVHMINDAPMLEDEEGRLSLEYSSEDVFEKIEKKVGEDHAQAIFDLFFC